MGRSRGLSGALTSDAELVAFCEREHPRLVGALSLYTNNTAVAEELAQEALVRVMDAWPRVRTMAAPGAWAHRVAMNLAASWFRRRSVERRALARPGGRGGEGRVEDCLLYTS